MSSSHEGYLPLLETSPRPPVPPKPKALLQKLPSAPAIGDSTIFTTTTTSTRPNSSLFTTPTKHRQLGTSSNGSSLTSTAAGAALTRSFSVGTARPATGSPKTGKPLPISPTKLAMVAEEVASHRLEQPSRVPSQKPSDYLVCIPSNSPPSSTTNSGSSSATSSLQDFVPSHHHKPKQPVTFATPPPREMEHIEREHPRNTFEYMEQMRKRGDLCDVTFVVDSTEIKAHKVVLAASSQYFESMFIGEFAEPEGESIAIDEVDEDAFIALVDFAYTSRIKLTDRNIYSLFEAADLLQFPGVKSSCFKFFKQQINKSNCIRTWLFAESHNCTELMEASVKYIECNFLDIVRGREFLNLEQPDIVAKLVQLEDLAITSEEQVYEAVLGWLQHDPEKRKEHAPVVFKHVRFASMSRDYLLHIVDHEPFIKEDPDCLQQVKWRFPMRFLLLHTCLHLSFDPSSLTPFLSFSLLASCPYS